jgi:hypothetical protein
MVREFGSIQVRIKARLAGGERLARTHSWPPEAGFGWSERAAAAPPEPDGGVATLLARLAENFPYPEHS